MPPSGVLRARLRPPRLPATAVERPTVVGRIVAGMEGRVVAVQAGGGFGKSTALVQAVQQTSMPWVWCTVDSRVAGASALAAHIAAGFAERYPGFGSGVRFPEDPAAAAQALSNEIDATVTEDVVLVLDDLHEVGGEPAGELALLLVADLPPSIHLVLAGRSLPALPARLRLRDLVEVTEDDLALDRGEAGAVLAASGLDVDAARVEAAWRGTSGWVAGLLLAVRSDLALQDEQLGSQGDLFAYLLDDIFLREPDDVREVLSATCILDRFDPPLAVSVSGVSGAEGIVRDLAGRALFTTRVEGPGEWYRHHHLLQAALRGRLGGDPRLRTALHLRAAREWARRGEPTEAIPHLLEAEEFDAAADMLAPIAGDLVSSSARRTAERWIATLPDAAWRDRPPLMLARAHAFLQDDRYDEAYLAFEDAAQRLAGGGHEQEAALATVRLLRAMLLGGEPAVRTREVAARLIPTLGPQLQLTRVARFQAAIALAQGAGLGDVEAELRTLSEEDASAEFPLVAHYAAVASAYLVDHAQGRSVEALAGIGDAGAAIERHEDRDILGYLFSVRAYTASILLDLGRWQEALAATDRWDEVIRRQGRASEALAFFRLEALCGLHRWEEVRRVLDDVEGLAGRLKGAGRSYLWHRAAARLALHDQHVNDVAVHAQAAREGLARHGSPRTRGTVLADLALVAHDAGLADLAADLLAGSRVAAEQDAMPLTLARAAITGAVVLGSTTEGDLLLSRAVELGTHSGVAGMWRNRFAGRAPRLLARAITTVAGPDGAAARLLAECGPNIRDETLALIDERAPGSMPVVGGIHDAPRITEDRPPLAFKSLGGFAVYRGGDVIPTSSFGRERARIVLAALLCAGTPVHRERLLEWCWPDLPADRGLRALHVTLYELRRGLEPELKKGTPSSYVVSEGETYRVAMGPSDAFDLTRFTRAARGALVDRDLDGLLACEALYTGTLYPEWPYAEWSRAPRDDAERLHRSVLDATAQALIDAGRPEDAVERYAALSVAEPETESWHRGLMLAYWRAGEPAKGLRQYHACRAILQRELGMEASAETRSLYGEILAAST